MLDRATQGIERSDDRALAHAIAAEALRRLPDLDELIDSATRRRLPDDDYARFAIRISLVQSLALGTPTHASFSTALPMVDGGPRKLVHGVFGTLMRGSATLPEFPSLPADVEARWQPVWGEEMVAAAERAIAAPPPLDLTLARSGGGRQRDWWRRDGRYVIAPRTYPSGEAAHVPELPGFEEGSWWVQDIAASLPGRLIGRGTESALDLCAAPGGKTMQLASAGWTVTAVDSSESRLARLSRQSWRVRASVR